MEHVCAPGDSESQRIEPGRHVTVLNASWRNTWRNPDPNPNPHPNPNRLTLGLGEMGLGEIGRHHSQDHDTKPSCSSSDWLTAWFFLCDFFYNFYSLHYVGLSFISEMQGAAMIIFLYIPIYASHE